MRIRKPNKRMLEYWLDEAEDGKIIPIKMPYKYVIESVCDMTGASKAYAIGKGQTWNPAMTYDYFLNMCEGKRIQHPESTALTKFLLVEMMVMGEDKFLKMYKEKKKGIKLAYEHGRFTGIAISPDNIKDLENKI